MDTKVIEVKPADNIAGWDNPYCDKSFIKYNHDINKMTDIEKEHYLIKPYVSKAKSKNK